MTNKTPAAAEATGEKITFAHNGVEYTVEPSSEWSYDTLEAYEEGKISGFLKGLLGNDQHNAFKATRPKVADVKGLVEAIQKALGISGN